MFALADIIRDLDKNEDVHLARLIVLIYAMTRKKTPSVAGITKLAKLDFLLRYPEALKRALRYKGIDDAKIPETDDDTLRVEASMIRYRYGPWDHRYRRFLNILVGKGLVHIKTHGRTINIMLTKSGYNVAGDLTELEGFSLVFKRATLIEKHFNMTASNITKYVYEVFPELSEMEYDEPIDLEKDGDHDV